MCKLFGGQKHLFLVSTLPRPCKKGRRTYPSWYMSRLTGTLRIMDDYGRVWMIMDDYAYYIYSYNELYI